MIYMVECLACCVMAVLGWADKLAEYTTYSMLIYLGYEWKLSFTRATGILNFWKGAAMILPIGFLFLVDAFLGNFLMLLLSSIAYGVGMGVLSLSVLTSSTGTCKENEPDCVDDTQKALFYTALALLAVGISGHSVSLKPFFDEQRTKAANDDSKKFYFQLLGLFMVTIVPIIGVFALNNVTLSWPICFGIPAVSIGVATLLFLSGWCSYVKVKPGGSSLINVCRVCVASTCKISRPFPSDAREIYKKDGDELQSFSHSRSRIIRGLEKAAIILPDKSLKEQENNRWRLCTVTEVEDTKVVFRMVPMWMTFVVCGIVSSIGHTYILVQAINMVNKLGKWTVPYPIFYLLVQYSKYLFTKSYPCLENCFDNNCKKYAPAVGIAVAMVFSILCCITSAIIETRRRYSDGMSMSIFWLLIPVFLIAGLDSFFENSSYAFFNNQAPKSMVSYLQHWSGVVYGLGYMGSVLLVYVVGKISEKGGRDWFRYDLNESRLDRYYWVLAALSSVNLLAYILIAYIYNYKEPEPPEEEQVNSQWLADLVRKRMGSRAPKFLVALVTFFL